MPIARLRDSIGQLNQLSCGRSGRIGAVVSVAGVGGGRETSMRGHVRDSHDAGALGPGTLGSGEVSATAGGCAPEYARLLDHIGVLGLAHGVRIHTPRQSHTSVRRSRSRLQMS